jgi:hypothetical protein
MMTIGSPVNMPLIFAPEIDLPDPAEVAVAGRAQEDMGVEPPELKGLDIQLRYHEKSHLSCLSCCRKFICQK